MKNTKKVIIGVIAGAFVLGTTGCSFSFHINRSSGSSVEKTITDSHGTEYVVKHNVKNENGETTEFYENAPCEIVNETGQAITGLYIVTSADDNWGNNLLVDNEGSFVLEDGERMCGITLSYDPDATTYDIKIDKEDGTSAEFDACGMKGLDDPMHMEMEFTTNTDGTNSVTIR